MTSRTDDFNRTNATSLGTPSDGGSAWLGSASNYGTTSNTGYMSGSAGWNTAVWLEASTTSADAQITWVSGTSVSSAVLMRVVDASNFLMGQFTTTGGFIWKRVSGTFTQIGSTYSGAFAAGDVIKVTCSGNSLAMFQNGTSRVTGTDATHNTATKFGFVENNGNTIRYDDFSVTDTGVASASSPAIRSFPRAILNF